MHSLMLCILRLLWFLPMHLSNDDDYAYTCFTSPLRSIAQLVMAL